MNFKPVKDGKGQTLYRKRVWIGEKQHTFTMSVNVPIAEVRATFVAWKKEREAAEMFSSMAAQDEKSVRAAGIFVGGEVVEIENSEEVARPKKIHTLIDLWKKDLERRGKIDRMVDDTDGMASGSVASYHSSIKHFLSRFGHAGLDEASIGEISSAFRRALVEQVSQKECAKTTANFRLQSMQMCLQWGKETGYVKRLPDAWRKTVKSITGRDDAERKPIVMKWSALKELWDVANPSMRSWILCALNFGFGQTDIAAMRKGCMDGEYLVGNRVKTHEPYKFKIWDITRNQPKLIRQRGEFKDEVHPFLFSSSTGKPIEDGFKNNHIDHRYRSYKLKIKSIREPLGERRSYDFYSIRRLGSTEVFSTHGYIYEVYLAHSIKGMGAHYANMSADQIQDKLNEATELLRLKAKRELVID